MAAYRHTLCWQNGAAGARHKCVKHANVFVVMEIVALALIICYAEARIFCEQTKMPLEVGDWRPELKHLDAAVVENKPVTINEGQIYVYENHFPGHTIKYIHVDNVARKTCGASATIKNGGVMSSSVLIILHAGANQEIRSVIDIWGVKNNNEVYAKPKVLQLSGTIKSLYLFKEMRAINHNGAF